MFCLLRPRVAEPGITFNCNPETVSTDLDKSDQLYFETVLDIAAIESPDGVVVSVGGQTLLSNLATELHHLGVRILGTSAEAIDTPENRSEFSSLYSLRTDQQRIVPRNCGGRAGSGHNIWLGLLADRAQV